MGGGIIEKEKKNVINLSSADMAQRVVKFNEVADSFNQYTVA